MSYFLYLKQSFRRRPMWHLNIYVIITCALILPLLFSIYLDSSSYGWSQQLISMAKGETFHIANADEKDAEVFRNIEGLSEPYWEDGTVYVHILDRKGRNGGDWVYIADAGKQCSFQVFRG